MNSRNNTIPISILAIAVLSAAAVWYSFYSRTFVALSINDAMDYASIGKNVAEGRGFVSSYITPLGLAHKGLPHPDLWRAPVWPAVLALFIKLCPPRLVDQYRNQLEYGGHEDYDDKDETVDTTYRIVGEE